MSVLNYSLAGSKSRLETGLKTDPQKTSQAQMTRIRVEMAT
jgi:hypothetical protein